MVNRNRYWAMDKKKKKEQNNWLCLTLILTGQLPSASQACYADKHRLSPLTLNASQGS